MKVGWEYVRCVKGVGEIDKAIELGEAGITQDRRMPGYYKNVALAYKAKGDIEAAKDTMSRSALRADEMRPWDEENTKAEFFDLYEELRALCVP
jgi:hypothetical protein